MLNSLVLLTKAVPESRLFALDSQTLISIGIQLLNAIILAVALTLILYKPVKNFMRKRSQGFQNKIDETEAAKAKAEELIAEYGTKIKNIDEERLEILDAAREKAAEESAAALEEARRESDELKKRTAENLSAERRRLKEEARLYIIELASLMAEKYISASMDDETQSRIFDRSLAELEKSPWQS